MNQTEMMESEDFYYEEQRRIKFTDASIVFLRESNKNDGIVVFAPINHENLYVDGSDKSPSSGSSSSSRLSDSSSLSPSDSDEESQSTPSRWKSTFEMIDIVWKLLLARALSKFQNLVTRITLCSFLRTLSSFYPILGIVIWWWMRNLARRRLRQGETVVHLRDRIKERDERIGQLLEQIARMNELLLE